MVYLHSKDPFGEGGHKVGDLVVMVEVILGGEQSSMLVKVLQR